MKELKYILHAFLLILAFISVIICLKAVYSIREPETQNSVIIDNTEVSSIYSKGKLLFQANCGSCHVLGKDLTGPSLCGFEERGPWAERENIYKWVRDPVNFMKKDQYTKDLKKDFSGVMMTAFPNLTNNNIDEIINFINNACEPGVVKN